MFDPLPPPKRFPWLTRHLGPVKGRLLREKRALQVGSRDRAANRRWQGAPKRFLVTRLRRPNPFFYDCVLDWLAERLPETRRLFELHLVSDRVEDLGPFALHVPWVPDPVQMWSQRAYEQALAMQARCDEAGIPVINRVDHLTASAKSNVAEVVRVAGIRTPVIVPILDADAFRREPGDMPFPLFIREGWGHKSAFHRADSPADLRDIPIESFERPIATEIVDVRDPRDGLCRKYRYVAAGNVGVPAHLHHSRDWVVRLGRCVYSETLRDEELGWTCGPDPNHAALLRAHRALGFDFVGFDYAYTPDGDLVVFEANPYPDLGLARARRGWRWPPGERVYAALVRLYLTRAGMPVPQLLDDLLDATGLLTP